MKNVLFVIFVCSPIVSGSVISFVSSGVIGASSQEFPEVESGDRFDLRVTYSEGLFDTSFLPLFPGGPSSGSFQDPLLFLELEVNDEFVFQEVGGSIQVFPQSTVSEPAFIRIFVGNITESFGVVTFFDFANTTILDDSLPEEVDFASLPDANFDFFVVNDFPVLTTTPSDISGTITLVSVPEPTIIAPLSLFTIMLLLKREKRRIQDQVQHRDGDFMKNKSQDLKESARFVLFVVFGRLLNRDSENSFESLKCFQGTEAVVSHSP